MFCSLLIACLAASSDALIIPRQLTGSSFPIAENNIQTAQTLLNTTLISSIGACQLPASLGLIAADYVVSISSYQLLYPDLTSTTCGMCVSISLGSVYDSQNQVMAIVGDECLDCQDGSLELSPTIYQKLLNLEQPTNTSQSIVVSWKEVACPSNANQIPTVSLRWSQSSAQFTTLQTYGLPFVPSEIYVSWDNYIINNFMAQSISWGRLTLPSSLFAALPRQLGFWSPPYPASSTDIINGPIGIRLTLRDGTILVSKHGNVVFGQDDGNILIGVWIPQGNVSKAVILDSVLRSDIAEGLTRKRDLTTGYLLSNALLMTSPDYGV